MKKKKDKLRRCPNCGTPLHEIETVCRKCGEFVSAPLDEGLVEWPNP